MSGKEHNTDDELMAAFIVGDSAAMETLFLRYRQSVYSWLLRMTGDVTEAEDIYQDVWLKVIRSASDYRPGNFKAWLWQIVRKSRGHTPKILCFTAKVSGLLQFRSEYETIVPLLRN